MMSDSTPEKQPPFAGGQGRTAESVREDGLGTAVVLTLSFIVLLGVLTWL